MNNQLISVSEPVQDPMSIGERIRRGHAIALLYIYSQHLSQLASDEACRLLEEANDSWQNFGFNQLMRRSAFTVRASGFNVAPILDKESEQKFKERVARMTTPPWMKDAHLPVLTSPWDQDPPNTLPI